MSNTTDTNNFIAITCLAVRLPSSVLIYYADANGVICNKIRIGEVRNLLLIHYCSKCFVRN